MIKENHKRESIKRHKNSCEKKKDSYNENTRILDSIEVIAWEGRILRFVKVLLHSKIASLV